MANSMIMSMVVYYITDSQLILYTISNLVLGEMVSCILFYQPEG